MAERNVRAADQVGPGETLIGEAKGDQLHVMSFNLRCPVDSRPHSWPERRPRIAELLRREHPTLLGTQEGFFSQLYDIWEDLRSHDWIHLHREGGSTGEAMAVFYDTARVKPLAYDHLWLSDTPRTIGSATWGNNVVRMVTWVRFLDRRGGRELVLLNTHFDHQSEEARERSSRMVRDLVATFDVPTIVTGDFNAGAFSPPYEGLVSGGVVGDTWMNAKERLTPEYGTFNGWNATPDLKMPRIDWVLATPSVCTHQVAINTDLPGGELASDHWPVQVLCELS